MRFLTFSQKNSVLKKLELTKPLQWKMKSKGKGKRGGHDWSCLQYLCDELVALMTMSTLLQHERNFPSLPDPSNQWIFHGHSSYMFAMHTYVHVVCIDWMLFYILILYQTTSIHPFGDLALCHWWVIDQQEMLTPVAVAKVETVHTFIIIEYFLSSRITRTIVFLIYY
jgi:hypothetical protein